MPLTPSPHPRIIVSSHTQSARHYNSDLSIWLSVDPMSDKYPGVSPYAYCANNPVVLKDPNGEDIYILFYTDNEKCFKASAETRKYNIEHSESFDPQKDKVFLFAISDLADVESKVSQTISQYSEQYGKTKEFGIWSHAGLDGPCGSSPTSGEFSLYGTQMSMEGWGRINFNWSDDGANASFYGCKTGYSTVSKESFAQRISRLDNFYNVEVRGQQTYAYPSMSPNYRTINGYQSIGLFSSTSTYMVGGSMNRGLSAIMGGTEAHPLASFKNGWKVKSTYQQPK